MASVVVRINAITVPVDSGEELVARSAAGAGALDGQPGFLAFDRLAPTDSSGG